MKHYWFLEEYRNDGFVESDNPFFTCRCIHEFYIKGQKGAINHQQYELLNDENCVHCAGRGVPTITWSNIDGN